MQHGAQAQSVSEPGMPPRLAARLVPVDDPEGEAFARACQRRPHGALRMGLRRLLGRFVSDYDANGLLGTHDMHLLGTEAWQVLLTRAGWRVPAGARLLDVGAGDGQVTEPLSALFDEVEVTELSRPMLRRLRRRGWRCHCIDLTHRNLPVEERFHAVALLNVLDRTDRPLTLLARARNLVRDDGCVLVAAPFPLSPHVHVGPDTVDPDEPLPQRGDSWEHGVAVFVRDALEPAGLEVRALARVPYLSRGPRSHPLVTLDDAVLVCAPS